MATRSIWQLTLPIWLAIGSSLLLWVGVFSEPAEVIARGSIDWPVITLTMVTNGLDRPVHITHAGDGSGRLFVVEQDGRIQIIKNGVLQGTFLDISSLTQGSGERGLLSVAFHPNYKNNGYFYVNYTRKSDGATVVARYSVSAGDPEVADPASALTILTVDQPFSNHNGGQLAFGPNDGYLYIGLGDGGSGGDPGNRAQKTDTLLGKLLRIDVDSGSPYGIPPDNPFAGPGNPLDEIWALGLRNPWRFSFDRQTGELYIGDVGQNRYEEVDFQSASSAGGENYGWRILEGAHCFNPPSDCVPPSGYSAPVAEYDHSEGCSVTGGMVYRGQNYPRMQGVYFYGDFCSGRIWGLKHDGVAWQNTLLLNSPHSISSFGEDEAGNLYLAHRSSSPNGAIYQITAPAPDLSLSTKSVSPLAGNPGQTFTYTVSLINTGHLLTQTTFLTDTLPGGLAYVPNTLTATLGTVDDSGRDLLWQGLLDSTQTVQITYQATATGNITGPLVNTALVKVPNVGLFTRTAVVLISPESTYLPMIFK